MSGFLFVASLFLFAQRLHARSFLLLLALLLRNFPLQLFAQSLLPCCFFLCHQFSGVGVGRLALGYPFPFCGLLRFNYRHFFRDPALAFQRIACVGGSLADRGFRGVCMGTDGPALSATQTGLWLSFANGIVRSAVQELIWGCVLLSDRHFSFNQGSGQLGSGDFDQFHLKAQFFQFGEILCGGLAIQVAEQDNTLAGEIVLQLFRVIDAQQFAHAGSGPLWVPASMYLALEREVESVHPAPISPVCFFIYV